MSHASTQLMTFWHPGLAQLWWFQVTARVKRTLRHMATPRRMLLTFVAILLATIWLGQGIAGILFREKADPSRLAVWIPCGFLAYALWTIVKTTCRKPIEPFEWTPAERELLLGAPLSRRHLVQYRLGSIVSAASLKAFCFAMVMLPDLRFWPLSFLGMLLALTFLDVLRMLGEVVVWGISRNQLLWLRAAVLTLAVGAGLSAVISTACLPTVVHQQTWPAPFGFVFCLGQSLFELHTTLPGQILVQPFRLFGAAILENGHLLLAIGRLMAATVTIFASAWLLVRCDAYFIRRRGEREESRFDQITTQTFGPELSTPVAAQVVLKVPPSCQGAYSLFWRQLRGMVHYRHSLALSFLLPAILSLLPLCSHAPTFDRTLHIICSLVFYSFLLLPSALRFDFRRDVERMAVIKALPISPAWTTIGQLAGPVMMCTIFQIVVLLIALIARPYPPMLLVLGLMILIPTNVLIFCMENAIFLLFPYRLNQEGISVFLRSILTFTAKGLLFVVALIGTIGVALISATVADMFSIGTHRTRLLAIFSVSMWILLTFCVAMAFALLARIYQRFDPSQDAPGLS